MSMYLKNLVDGLVWIISVVVGFIAVGKTRRIDREVCDSRSLCCECGGLSLLFDQLVECFSPGIKMPCLVRKQADVSDPLITS